MARLTAISDAMTFEGEALEAKEAAKAGAGAGGAGGLGLGKWSPGHFTWPGWVPRLGVAWCGLVP